MHVEAAEVGHHFSGGQWLFARVNFLAAPGQVVALTGPSGSGKTTLLSILAGREEPAAGQVNRVGVHRIQRVFQNPHGVPHRLARDHVVLPLLARGRRRRQAEQTANTLLDDFGLSEVGDRVFSMLSGGEAQRLMLARALAAAPDLMLVDEPTAQLDSRSTNSVIESLQALAGRGAIVVVATHDPAVADACTRIIDLGASA